MSDNDKNYATMKLMSELAKGENSGQENGWITADEVERRLELSIL